jgi:hypothetical protein
MGRALRFAVAAAFALVSGVAVAAMDPAKVAAAKKAGDDFLVLAKGSETNGTMPRQTDPKVKPLLELSSIPPCLGKTCCLSPRAGSLGSS